MDTGPEDNERRAFLAAMFRAMGGTALLAGAAGAAAALTGCTPPKQDPPGGQKSGSGKGGGRSRRRSRRKTVPREFSEKQTRWTEGQHAQAVARIRVAEILKAGESGKWALYDAVTGKRLQGAKREFTLPEKTDLQELAFALCGYAALRAGHLGPYQRVLCDGDRGAPQGHGRLNIIAALTRGCPTFFERLATRITYEEFRIGARLMGLHDVLPDRPAGFMDRMRLYAHGRGFPVGLDDLAALGRGLSRWDPGDEARVVVQLGWLQCARKGVAQRAAAPPLTVAAFKTPVDPKTRESKVLAWTPARSAQFIVCVRAANAQTDAADVAGRIFRVIAPLEAETPTTPVQTPKARTPPARIPPARTPKDETRKTRPPARKSAKKARKTRPPARKP